MKYREDFVTNSSSSSYIVIAKVDMCPALLDEMKEEYGKYGIRMMDENIITGKELINIITCRELIGTADREEKQYIEDHDVKEDDYYIFATFYTHSIEDYTNDEDVWLYEHLPKEYLSDIYKGESDWD